MKASTCLSIKPGFTPRTKILFKRRSNNSEYVSLVIATKFIWCFAALVDVSVAVVAVVAVAVALLLSVVAVAAVAVEYANREELYLATLPKARFR